jgi:hypothetical protein
LGQCAGMSPDWPASVTGIVCRPLSEVDFLVGQSIKEFRVWFGGIRIVFEEGERVEPDLYIDLSDFDYLDAAGHREHPDVEKRETIGPALKLIGQTVASTSTEGDVLQLTFEDGSSLSCAPAHDYEAWQVIGGDPNWLVVALPGGGISIGSGNDWRPLP